MTLDELYANIDKDFSIDETDIGNESLRSANLFQKYIRLYTDSKLQLELLLNKRKNLICEKREYYAGNAAPEVYKEKPFDLRIKTEAVMEKYLDSDIDIVKYDEKIVLQQEKVNALRACLETIKNRNFQIKNYIDYQKFINGL